MFELDQFITDCRAALAADRSHKLVHEVVARAVSDPGGVLRGLGEPKRAQLQKLYHAPDLTILNVIWAPTMTIMPHDHRMWAVIGIYSGREENSFYHRSESGLQAHGAKTLDLKETLPLGEAVIHAVTNPLDRITAALHVYGGDFFTVPRSEWDPQTFQERPFDIEHAKEVFAEANKRLVSPDAVSR